MTILTDAERRTMHCWLWENFPGYRSLKTKLDKMSPDHRAEAEDVIRHFEEAYCSGQMDHLGARWAT